jgi:hypothetical protein
MKRATPCEKKSTSNRSRVAVQFLFVFFNKLKKWQYFVYIRKMDQEWRWKQIHEFDLFFFCYFLLNPNEEVYCSFQVLLWVLSYFTPPKKKIPKISKVLWVSSYLLQKKKIDKKISKFSSDEEKLKIPSYNLVT